MRHPGLGTALFALLGPPLVAVGVVPWLLSRWRLDEPFFGWQPWRWIGAICVALGALVVGESMVRFARRGRGTPAPWAPPERFVASGLYRRVRNPMYIGVLGTIVGQGLLLRSWAVLVWAACTAAGFHLFVVGIEEPALRRRFGAEYAEYCRRVRRWLPRSPSP